MARSRRANRSICSPQSSPRSTRHWYSPTFPFSPSDLHCKFAFESTTLLREAHQPNNDCSRTTCEAATSTMRSLSSPRILDLPADTSVEFRISALTYRSGDCRSGSCGVGLCKKMCRRLERTSSIAAARELIAPCRGDGEAGSRPTTLTESMLYINY